MKVVLVEHDKTQSIKEVDPLKENETRNLRLVQDCYQTVDGERLPVYVRRVYEAVDEHLCRELKSLYSQK